LKSLVALIDTGPIIMRAAPAFALISGGYSSPAREYHRNFFQ
jgi:hypothetical protein